MSFGFTVNVDETEIVDPDQDDVVGFACAPQFAEQIEPLAGGEQPFRKDRGNVLCVTRISCSRTHDSLAEAAAYVLSVISDTPREGDAEIIIDPTGSAPAAYDFADALIRAEPQPFVGATTLVTFTIISGPPVAGA